MNLLFLLIAAGLTAATLALILPPIWRSGAIQADDIDQRNIRIARDRLAELKANRQAGGIDQTQYDEQVSELEQTLLDDLSLEKPVSVLPRRGRWMASLLVVTVPLLSISLYWALGNFQAVGHGDEMAVAPANPTADVVKMVEGLAERMKSDPDNAEGWLMLGRSYKYLEQYPKAVEAFANAYRLLGDKPEVMLLYAEAIAFASDKNMAGKPSELIFKALEQEPDNLNGLWLGGLAKIQQNDKASALTLWRRLESLLPPDSDARKEIETIIASLPGQTQASAGQPQTPAVKASASSIAVEVALAPEMQALTNPGDAVFIYAQALSGPKMPLAIVRKQVADLPVKVMLDDTTAMMPTMKLTHFTEVRLLARVSKSGQAATQPGDLIGSVEKVAVNGSTNQRIVIDQRVQSSE